MGICCVYEKDEGHNQKNKEKQRKKNEIDFFEIDEGHNQKNKEKQRKNDEIDFFEKDESHYQKKKEKQRKNDEIDFFGKDVSHNPKNKEKQRKNDEINFFGKDESHNQKNKEKQRKKDEFDFFEKDEEHNQKNKDKRETHNEKKRKTMYDAIFSCDSLKNLFDQGWNFLMKDKFKKRFEKEVGNIEESDKICPLCMLGDSTKGKTFISKYLIDDKSPRESGYKTMGISCKLSDFSFINIGNKKEKFLIFDSAGRSEPLLIEPEKKKDLDDETLKMEVESKNRDLKESEEFMRNFLINNSQIIIVMVNQLSLSEQLFLYQLKSEKKYEELFIIHNLYILKTKKEIEDYINNTIINSIYFDLSKGYFDTLDKNEIFRPYYFKEEQNQSENDQALIAHLILGDIETKDEWIKHFNERTIDFLKDKMQVCLAKEYFLVEKQLEKELHDTNKIDEKSQLNKEKIEHIGNEEKGVLKIANKDKMKKHESGDFIPNTEFSIMTKYTPDYIFYKDEENFIIEVECAGEFDDSIKIEGKYKLGKVYFNIKGKKKYPKELKDYLKKEDEPFSIYFNVNTEKEEITIDTSPEINMKKPIHENGIYKKKFPIKKEETTQSE